MKSPHRGEVWLVDLGMAVKVRPALAISVPADDADRALVTMVTHDEPTQLPFRSGRHGSIFARGRLRWSKPDHNSARETGQSARQTVQRSTVVHRAGGEPVAWIADHELRGLAN
jgi:hypothetical protein